MFCVDCGNEIPDDSNVCPFCGVIIEDGYEMQGTKKSMGKYPFLIAGIVLAAVVVIVAGVLVLKGRSIEKTVEKYAEAVDEEDEKLLYKLMFPNKFRKDAKDLLRDGSNVLEEMDDGEQRLYEGDRVTIRAAYYDEKEILYTLFWFCIVS